MPRAVGLTRDAAVRKIVQQARRTRQAHGSHGWLPKAGLTGTGTTMGEAPKRPCGRKLLSLAATGLTATLLILGVTGCSHPCDGDGGIKTSWKTGPSNHHDLMYLCNDGTTQSD